MSIEQIQSELATATAMMASMYAYWLHRTQDECAAYRLARAACSGNYASYQKVKQAEGVVL